MIARSFKTELSQTLSLIGPRKWKYSLGLLGLALVNSSIAFIIPFVLRDMSNAAISGKFVMVRNTVIILLIYVLFLSILSPIFTFMYNRSVKEIMMRLRIRIYGHILDSSFTFWNRMHSGDILSRITTDMQVMERIFNEYMRNVLQLLIIGTGALVVMFIFDWRFAVASLFFSIAIVIANIMLMGSLRKSGDEVQRKSGLLLERFCDLINGIQVVKMFQLERYFTRIIDQSSGDVKQSTIIQGKKTGVFDSINYMSGLLFFCATILVGSFLVTKGAMKVGDLVAVVSLQMNVIYVSLNINNNIAQLQGSFSGVGRIMELLHEPSESHEVKNHQSSIQDEQAKEAVIALNDLHFYYNEDNKVLDSLSLSIGVNQTAAIVGSSGSGKSTVFKILLGYYPVDQQTVSLFGQPIEQYSLHALRELFSYVPQSSFLFEGTIADNIRYGNLNATQEEIVEAAKLANAHDFITGFTNGYMTEVGEVGAFLSGGQRQRICIARALLKNAPILLLDEATSALDSASEQLVQQSLKHLMHNKTTLIIAHRLATIESADIIFVLDQGRVAEQGNHQELIAAKGLYSQMYYSNHFQD